MFLINGLIYGTLLFAVIMLWWWVATKRRARRGPQRAGVDVTTTSYSPSAEISSVPHFQFSNLENIELQELKRMYDAGQLSDVEYWRKLNQILERTANQSTASVGTSDKTSEIENDLAQLKELRDEDLITEQDYVQKKTEILSRL
jgi:hypothetical protein